MCLITKQSKPDIAEKDIKVYKILLKRGEKFLPMYSKLYEEDYEYVIGENKPSTDGKLYGDVSGYNILREGWLHAFTDLEDARLYCHWEEFYNKNVFVIAEMTIPYDTEYFTSNDDTTICSKKLVWEGKLCV